jgi:hypothetical protein
LKDEVIKKVMEIELDDLKKVKKQADLLTLCTYKILEIDPLSPKV